MLHVAWFGCTSSQRLRWARGELWAGRYLRSLWGLGGSRRCVSPGLRPPPLPSRRLPPKPHRQVGNWKLEVGSPLISDQLTLRRMGWGMRSAQVKGGGRRPGDTEQNAYPNPSHHQPPPTRTQSQSAERPKQPRATYASRQCTAQHPSPEPPTVPRETLAPTMAAPSSPPPGACPSSPSRCPAPPKPPPTKS